MEDRDKKDKDELVLEEITRVIILELKNKSIEELVYKYNGDRPRTDQGPSILNY